MDVPAASDRDRTGVLARIRGHLSYANVVATIALFFAVSTGGAYAAQQWTGANIKNGTLTGADVKNKSLTGADIKDGRVASVDVTDGSLTGADVADGSLTGADVADNSIASADVAPLHGDVDIQDNSITTFDLADNSVDADEVLDFGLTNQDVGVLFAQIDADGTVVNSSGGVTVSRLGTGQYEVDFGRNVSSAAFVATQGEAGAGGAPGAIMGVADRSGNVEAAFVSVRDANNALVDRAFQIVVVN
jgi:hypothetical protein